jgi:predicted Zn-dependent protease with MMP-like domain
LHANGAEPGKAVADLKKLTAWQRLWPHLRRKRRLYFRANEPATPEEFEIAAQAIWDGLPGQFRKALDNVTLQVADFADAETLEALRIRERYDLLGLYQGAGLPSKSVWDPVSLPDRIFLYRIPIIDYARRKGQRLDRVIRHVLIHEIGHHFGFSDADMAWIEDGA